MDILSSWRGRNTTHAVEAPNLTNKKDSKPLIIILTKLNSPLSNLYSQNA